MKQNRAWSKRARGVGASLLVLSTFLPLSAEAQWVFVARHVIGRVQQITQQQDGQTGVAPQRVTQVATVILDAPASKVYQVASNATMSNPNITVVSNDPVAMTISIREDDQVATLNVTSLNTNVSQLMVVGSAPAGESPQTSRIVSAALRLCGDLGKTCTVGNN